VRQEKRGRGKKTSRPKKKGKKKRRSADSSSAAEGGKSECRKFMEKRDRGGQTKNCCLKKKRGSIVANPSSQREIAELIKEGGYIEHTEKGGSY